MLKQLNITLATTVLLLFGANIAAAQDQSFCDMRSGGLLAALEGPWSFKQGAGYGVAGKALPFPLPAHPAQLVSLEYDADKDVLFMRHAGESLALIEVPLNYSKESVFFLTPEEEARIMVPSTECSQENLPSLVGTNSYALENSVSSKVINVLDAEFTIASCVSTERDPLIEDVVFVTEEVDGKLWVFFASQEVVEDFSSYDGELQEYYRDVLSECTKETAPAGNIALSLVLRFDTLNSATGIIQFRLKMSGVGGAARAPVTLTRVGG